MWARRFPRPRKRCALGGVVFPQSGPCRFSAPSSWRQGARRPAGRGAIRKGKGRKGSSSVGGGEEGAETETGIQAPNSSLVFCWSWGGDTTILRLQLVQFRLGRNTTDVFCAEGAASQSREKEGTMDAKRKTRKEGPKKRKERSVEKYRSSETCTEHEKRPKKIYVRKSTKTKQREAVTSTGRA
jgi:hypothetical protein